MKAITRVIDTLALIVIAVSAMSVLVPSATPASASSPYGEAVCFYKNAARRIEKNVYQFKTTNPTEKMYLVLGAPGKGGIILYDDGGPSNAALNALFPHLAHPSAGATNTGTEETAGISGASIACFYPETATVYKGRLENGNRYFGYSFRMVNDHASLVLELTGSRGMIVCNDNKTKPDYLDKLFPKLGC